MGSSCVFGMGVKSTKHNTTFDHADPRYEFTAQILRPKRVLTSYACFLFAIQWPIQDFSVEAPTPVFGQKPITAVFDKNVCRKLHESEINWTLVTSSLDSPMPTNGAVLIRSCVFILAGGVSPN